MSNIAIALIYAGMGIRIFPCRESDNGGGSAKSPYIAGGLHAASADEIQIRIWWALWPNAVVGMPCRSNDLIVIDADRHGSSDGVAALLTLFVENRFDQGEIPYVRTPRDGRHCIFKRPQGLKDARGRIAPAIDVRDNAYIIAPGSIMASGRGYELAAGSPKLLAAAIAGKTLAEMPRWLRNLVEKPDLPYAQFDELDVFAYKQTDIPGQLARILGAVARSLEGTRNGTLYWAACRFGELVGTNSLRMNIATLLLMDAGLSVGLSRREARATARSGIREGIAKVCGGGR